MGGKPSKLARDDQPSDSEAYCLPCDPDRESAPPLVGREKSIVDDHSLAWARYVHAPSTHGGAAPFNPAGATTAVAAAVSAIPAIATHRCRMHPCRRRPHCHCRRASLASP